MLGSIERIHTFVYIFRPKQFPFLPSSTSYNSGSSLVLSDAASDFRIQSKRSMSIIVIDLYDNARYLVHDIRSIQRACLILESLILLPVYLLLLSTFLYLPLLSAKSTQLRSDPRRSHPTNDKNHPHVASVLRSHSVILLLNESENFALRSAFSLLS